MTDAKKSGRQSVHLKWSTGYECDLRDRGTEKEIGKKGESTIQKGIQQKWYGRMNQASKQYTKIHELILFYASVAVEFFFTLNKSYASLSGVIQPMTRPVSHSAKKLKAVLNRLWKSSKKIIRVLLSCYWWHDASCICISYNPSGGMLHYLLPSGKVYITFNDSNYKRIRSKPGLTPIQNKLYLKHRAVFQRSDCFRNKVRGQLFPRWDCTARRLSKSDKAQSHLKLLRL